jgi:hypothetical protein
MSQPWNTAAPQPRRSFGGCLTNAEKIAKVERENERLKRKEEAVLKKTIRKTSGGASKEVKKARANGTFVPRIKNIKPSAKAAGSSIKDAKSSGKQVKSSFKEGKSSTKPTKKDVKPSTKGTERPKKQMQSRSLLTEGFFDKNQTTIHVGTLAGNSHDPSVPEEKRSSVLYRPTARAIFQKEQQEAKEEALEAAGKALGPERTGVFRFLYLKKDIRDRIYRDVAVSTSCFKWPVDSLLDRQQPDLAMVCQQIRKEFLPFYYLENRFAITLPGVVVDDGKPNPKFVLLEKWLDAIGNPDNEGGRWLGKIRRWVFDGAVEPVVEEGKEDAGEANKVSEIVKPAVTQFGRSPLSKEFILCLKYRSRVERSVSLRIHRQAACILPQFAAPHISCEAKDIPDRIRAHCTSWRDIIAMPTSVPRAKRLTRLAGKLNTLAPELVNACCKDTSIKKPEPKPDIKATQATLSQSLLQSRPRPIRRNSQ